VKYPEGGDNLLTHGWGRPFVAVLEFFRPTAKGIDVFDHDREVVAIAPFALGAKSAVDSSLALLAWPASALLKTALKIVKSCRWK
jgi:hypothetical protein